MDSNDNQPDDSLGLIHSGSKKAKDRPQGTHWTSERLHADVQRAVGGTLNLIRELSRVSEEIDGKTSAEWMVKRIQFLAYELRTKIAIDLPESGRLAALNSFFFEAKQFHCVHPAHSVYGYGESGSNQLQALGDSFRLNRVLSERAGVPTVLALIYAYLAEKIGVFLEFVDLKPACFLKWSEEGRSRYIDITRSGTVLTSDELIETLHTRFRMTNLCHAGLLETFSFETYLADYLTGLKLALDPMIDPEKLLFVQNTLIAYQPSNIHLIGERALLHRRIGNFKSALTDLKRYFTFHDREKAPIELVELYNELARLLDRNKTQVELRD